MQCPKCKAEGTRVIDSREGVDGRSVRRRRECEKCNFRYTTFERIEENLPLIVKKGGEREVYDRNKVLGGLKKACEKRPVTMEQMEEIARIIESRLIDSGDKELSSQMIGEMLIEQLQLVDQVAYVRFASVYREFSDVSEFVDALRHLVSHKTGVVGGKRPAKASEDLNSGSEKNDERKTSPKSQEVLKFPKNS